jgi:hypothetical protein
MATEKRTFNLAIAQRPWYEWLLWAIWLVVELFTLQNAIASSIEYEPRAAMIFWITFAVLLIGGAVVWFVRRVRLTK